MQTTSLDLVTLPDGTTWLRLADRMVRWTTSAEFLGALGLVRHAAGAPCDDEVTRAVTRLRHTDPPASGRASAPVRRTSGRATDPAIVAEARKLFETTNQKLTAIAQQVGMKLPTLHKIATREGWKRQALVKGSK